MGLNIGLDSEYEHKVYMCVRLCVRLAANGETAVEKALHSSYPRLAGTTHTTCSLPTAALTPHTELTIRENPYMHHFPNPAIWLWHTAVHFFRLFWLRTISIRDTACLLRDLQNTLKWTRHLSELKSFLFFFFCILIDRKLYIMKMRREGNGKALKKLWSYYTLQTI